MHPRILFALLVAGSAASTPLTASERVEYEGRAYALDDGGVLYSESHFVDRESSGRGRRVVLYRCGDGSVFARKRIDYDAGDLVPDFEMQDARLGYREGVRREGGRRTVFVQRSLQREERSGPLPQVDGLVADAGFDDFVRRHWDALAAGETLRFPILVPSRIDWFDFKVRKAEGVADASPDTLVFRLSLGSWFAFLLPHIDVRYARDPRALLGYTGITSVRDLTGRNYQARIEFPQDLRKPLGDGALQAALDTPLASACAG